MVTSEPMPGSLMAVQSIVMTSGCPDLRARYMGSEIVLEGCVPSFEMKMAIEQQVREATGAVVRNGLRVVPS